jgi:hypothetical protein
MVVSDRVYYRIPKFWLIIGVVFLLLGFVAGPDYRLFWAHMSLGGLCIARSWHISYQRRQFNRRRHISVLTKTQRLEESALSRPHR